MLFKVCTEVYTQWIRVLRARVLHKFGGRELNLGWSPRTSQRCLSCKRSVRLTPQNQSGGKSRVQRTYVRTSSATADHTRAHNPRPRTPVS